MKSKTDRIILGIDPGTTIMGYGLIHIKANKMEMITMGVLHLSKLNSHADKLKRIFERTLALIDEYKADEMALEAPFFGKNVQSMLKLGRAQGVAMAAGLYRDIPIFEYAPKKIKMSEKQTNFQCFFQVTQNQRCGVHKKRKAGNKKQVILIEKK